MTIRTLPGAPTGRPSASVRSEISQNAWAKWDVSVRAAAENTDRSISIYDVIGQDYWTGEGVSAKRVAAALRSMGDGPVTVNINSPGGDMFEGLAIYSLLREHKGEVTVKVLGLAASAASVIAMAADKTQIARAGFLMIHNAWVVAAADRNGFYDLASWLKPFDAAMADIYAAKTGGEAKSIMKMMDAETWIGGGDAVSQGFADALLDSDQVAADGAGKASAMAARRVEAALRESGFPKSEAMRLISEIKTRSGDPAGDGEGDPTEGGRLANLKTGRASVLSAELTSILR